MTSTRRLPDAWVQRIFVTLQGHYGTRFLNMWKTGQVLPDGSDAGVANAMNTWAEKLGGYASSPQTIKRVLETLPNDPPTLPQFCELCRLSWVPPETPRLTHQFTEEEMAANRAKLAEMIRKVRKTI